MTIELNNYRLPSTIRHNVPSLYGHWFDPELKPMRDAAREWARQQGYYDKEKGQ